jgi:ribosomal protein S17E
MISFYKKRITRVFLFAVMAVALADCSSAGRFIKSARSPYRTMTYKETLDTWSREARIHQGFAVELIVSATFKSKAFRRAYAEEYGEVFRLTQEENKRFVEDQIQAADKNHEFVVATFVPEKKWDEFDKPDSMWKFYLFHDGDERVEPLEVKKRKERDATVSYFFPYVTPWKSVYVVKFPHPFPGSDEARVGNETKSITLVITSVLGAAELAWDLDETEIGNHDGLPRGAEEKNIRQN